MKTPEQLLLEGKERRERQKRLRDALGAIKKSTERRVGMALINLIFAGVFGWMVFSDYATQDPMTKSDALGLVIHILLIAILIHSAISYISTNHRDIALRDILQKQIDEEGA